MAGSNPSQGQDDSPRGADADSIDYQHRNFVNLVAAIALLVVAIGVVWVVKAMVADETLNRCFESGRRDCVSIEEPPRQTIRMPDN
ncbi:MAG TPA: hypothetical protein VG271_19295 [Beijerinckiaceae bacterium]|jgi:hypothetical protein|nr:hypothetical protein [Beijerinckiaceae bacterium]